MKTRFDPHKSLLHLDANIVVLLLYLVSIVSIFLKFIPVITILSLAVAVVIFFVEKESNFVRFHAMQAILMCVAGFVFEFIFFIILKIVVLTLHVHFLHGLLIISPFSLVVEITMFVLMIIATIKGWNYESYEIPVLGKLATKIVFK